MKIKKVVFILLLPLCSWHSTPANPFSSKIELQLPPDQEKPARSEISYRGYVIINNETFAIIQFKGQQLTLKEGETAYEIRIGKITDKQIQYTLHGKIHTKDLETGP